MPRDPICFTCCHAIGSEDALQLICTLRGVACNRRCDFYEREAGADVPEHLVLTKHASNRVVVMHSPKFTRDAKRAMREARH